MQKLSFYFLFFFLFSVPILRAQGVSGAIYASERPTEKIPYAKLNFVDLDILILADSLGNWVMPELANGTYRIEVSAYGFQSTFFNQEISGQPVKFYLSENHRELDKLIITHHGVLQNQSITAIESLPLNDLNSIPTPNLGEALTNIPGVYQTGIGQGVSKPVIRGLSGSSVVTYVNSLRIENQQWGSDHGLPITGLGIGSVEVIKGPASLLYGADALGGVLYFVDEPYVAAQTFQVAAQSKFDVNTMGTSNQLGYKSSWKKLRLNSFLSYDNHADYQLPSGNYVLNSRYKQAAGKLALGYTHKNWVINLRYNYYQGRIGLPGDSHEDNPVPLDFQSTNQNRTENLPAQFIRNHFIAVEQKLFFRKQEFHLTLGHTRNQLNEYEEKFFTPDLTLQLNNSLYNAKWRLKLTENMDLFVGSQGMLQFNTNGKDAPEILIPDAKTADVGVYTLYTYKYKKWRFQAGARVDNRSINTQDLTNFNQSYQGYNSSLGLARLGKKSSLRLNLSTGFRAPTSSELLSDGVHHGAFRYERGNANLTTEKAVQLDVSYALHFDDLEVIVNPFYNRISDYIYLQKTNEIEEGFVVYDYSQAEFAQLYGTDFGVHYHPHNAHWLHIESNFSTVFAEDEFKNPLPLIPQTRINNQVRFDFNQKGKVQLTNLIVQHLYFFKQNRLGDFETNTSGYHLINVGLQAKIDAKTPLFIAFGVRNLLNANYIDHLSGLKTIGINNPGINFYTSLKIELNETNKSK